MYQPQEAILLQTTTGTGPALGEPAGAMVGSGSCYGLPDLFLTIILCVLFLVSHSTLAIWCLRCVCVCVCERMHACMCLHVHMWSPEVDVLLHLFLFYLSTQRLSLHLELTSSS